MKRRNPAADESLHLEEKFNIHPAQKQRPYIGCICEPWDNVCTCHKLSQEEKRRIEIRQHREEEAEIGMI